MENKKIVRQKIVFVIVTIIILSCCVFSVSAYAVSEKCLADHFNNLNDIDVYDGFFMPPNPDGSCAYVAMSLLISFYDTYWNDRFVPNNLEWNNGVYNSSSDSLQRTFIELDEASAWNDYSGSFKEFINNTNNQDTFLQPYLYSIGKSKLYHLLEPNNFGLNDQQMVNVLMDYLYNTCDFTTDEVTVNYLMASDDVLFAKMKEQIDKGFPVMFIGKKIADENAKNTSGTTNEGKIGHVMIAYSVEQNEGVEDIKLHLGYSWDSPYAWVNTTEYQYLNAIIWLEINENTLSHDCSDNYVDSVTGEELCACQIYETHPNHSSNHYYVQKMDYSKHWQECCCGDIIEEESHNYSYTYYNAIQHKATCDDCKYETIPTHTYVEKANASKRWKECVCGDYIFLHYHDFEHINYSESEHLLSCTYCDYETLASHEYTDYINENKQWQECVCGNTIINHYHSFEYIYNSENDHVASCTICSYAMNITHDYAPKSISSTQHQQTCVCGDTIGEAEDHYEAEYHSVSNFMHGVHCECGQLIHTETHSMTTVGLNNVCTDCGFVMSGLSGGITIKGEEDEFDTCTE